MKVVTSTATPPPLQVEHSSNHSSSRLGLTAQPSDTGAQYTCRVVNPRLPNHALEETYTLNVHCEYTWVHLGTPGHTRVHLGTPGYTWVHLGTPGYT